jgi:hypothetical protein
VTLITVELMCWWFAISGEGLQQNTSVARSGGHAAGSVQVVVLIITGSGIEVFPMPIPIVATATYLYSTWAFSNGSVLQHIDRIVAGPESAGTHSAAHRMARRTFRLHKPSSSLDTLDPPCFDSRARQHTVLWISCISLSNLCCEPSLIAGAARVPELAADYRRQPAKHVLERSWQAS